MAIVFSCPHCGEGYKLKDELAGKRATCKRATCRKVIVIPAPAPAQPGNSGPAPKTAPRPSARPTNGEAPPRKPETPRNDTPPPKAPIDADALALSALADEPPAPEPVVEEATMKVHCDYCDADFMVERSRQGKNVPCPECRRLIKVPLIVQEKPKDWRDTRRNRPSLARDDTPALEGVMSARDTEGLSIQTIKDAGLVPVEYEPIPLGRKIKWVALGLGLVLAVAAGVMYFIRSRVDHGRELRMADAVKAVEDEGAKAPELHAAIHELAGEYALRKAQAEGKEQLDLALRHFGKARGALVNAPLPPNHPDRAPLLAELALLQVGLGGDAEAVKDDRRIPWDKAQTEIRQTLQNLPPGDLRFYTLRALTQRLAAAKEGPRAAAVARLIFTGNELPEALAQVGLELAKANQKEAALEVAKQAEALLGDAKSRRAAPPGLIALRLALNPGEQFPVPAGEPAPELRIGFAEGLAMQGKFEPAREIAGREGRDPEPRLRALAAVAAVAVDANQPGEAAPALDAAAAVLAQIPQGKAVPPWLGYRLAQLAARAGKVELAQQFANAIPEEGVRPWARLEILRARLAAQPKQKGEDGWLKDFGEPAQPTAAQALAHEAFARHSTAAGYSEIAKTVEGWKQPLKAFGQAGITLGQQDRKLGR